MATYAVKTNDGTELDVEADRLVKDGHMVELYNGDELVASLPGNPTVYKKPAEASKTTSTPKVGPSSS